MPKIDPPMNTDQTRIKPLAAGETSLQTTDCYDLCVSRVHRWPKQTSLAVDFKVEER